MDSTSKEESSSTNAETTKASGSQSNAQTPTSKPKSNVSKSGTTLDDANEELSQLIISGKIKSDDVRCLKASLKEHVSLKEKVEKLKSLLGRSAKAQREAKVDSETAQKRLGQAMKEIERLNKKLDKLQTRPTHMDLLMDFETNFDKALLSVGQSGGQETSDAEPTTQAMESSDLDTMDDMLMQELGEAKNRIEKLETLNTAMMSRSSQLEESAKVLQKERDEARNSSKRLQMELRMANLEAEQANRAMIDKVASLEEMQMEIDLVTKANAKANVRAAKGEEAANSLKSDKNHIQQLESQVQALKEWALASAEAKQLMHERCRILEGKLKLQQGKNVGNEKSNAEKLLFTKTGSMVIGAGANHPVHLSLGEHATTVDSRFVILRWKFDSSPSDMTVDFNIMKGTCTTSSEYAKADYLIKGRMIQGGAGGETEGAFNTDSACTILWSNAKSWIRPVTVKYSIGVVALK
ncbi:unnamed protein product [Pseudo-nitzschia multistriata]|uniref:Uncharacterized protein n=1 Tax=Pseudo-nitzschia multistriata TaxID=183589 RepID=A0A448Z6S4_9STRA|nr:unnamed protein product [Pseudo-nitzschia multistriata]